MSSGRGVLPFLRISAATRSTTAEGQVFAVYAAAGGTAGPSTIGAKTLVQNA